MLMNPLCNRLSLRQAARRVSQLCDQALAPLDLRATQLSMLRKIDRLGLPSAPASETSQHSPAARHAAESTGPTL
jgi:hypothetical protein